MIRVLMLEDSAFDAELSERELKRTGIELTCLRVEDQKTFQEALTDYSPEIILSDYSLPRFSGMEALRMVRHDTPAVPLIIVTGAINEETAVECMKAGAADYVIKEHLGRLGPAVKGALEKKRAITESLRSEEALRKSVAELARSNKELEEFTYVASHDLQQPLRMVTSYVQLLAKRYQGRLDTDADDFIRFAVDGAERMKDLINALLEYSRVGRKEKILQPTDCRSALDAALANLRFTMEETEAIVTCDTLPVIQGDPVQLIELFQNLIGNAVKFHAEAAPQIHITAEQKEQEWIFSVRDNGIGIDLKHRERIFALFQRLHTVEKYPGTGLGLAICKKIVERHGGRIWADSHLGKGSVFYFAWPAAS